MELLRDAQVRGIRLPFRCAWYGANECYVKRERIAIIRSWIQIPWLLTIFRAEECIWDSNFTFGLPRDSLRTAQKSILKSSPAICMHNLCPHDMTSQIAPMAALDSKERIRFVNQKRRLATQRPVHSRKIIEQWEKQIIQEWIRKSLGFQSPRAFSRENENVCGPKLNCHDTVWLQTPKIKVKFKFCAFFHCATLWDLPFECFVARPSGKPERNVSAKNIFANPRDGTQKPSPASLSLASSESINFSTTFFDAAKKNFFLFEILKAAQEEHLFNLPIPNLQTWVNLLPQPLVSPRVIIKKPKLGNLFLLLTPFLPQSFVILISTSIPKSVQVHQTHTFSLLWNSCVICTRKSSGALQDVVCAWGNSADEARAQEEATRILPESRLRLQFFVTSRQNTSRRLF